MLTKLKSEDDLQFQAKNAGMEGGGSEPNSDLVQGPKFLAHNSPKIT
jgi:hypothetical protein